VGLYDAHQNTASFLHELARRCEHRVGLTYTGRSAKVDAQLPTLCLRLLLLELREQSVRVGSISIGCGHGLSHLVINDGDADDYMPMRCGGTQAPLPG
jgi:hypothetical protein